MVSIGPNSQSYNMTHMFHIPDLRKCVSNSQIYSKNSLMDIISKEPDFSKFNYIIQLAGLQNTFDNCITQESQFNQYTIFIPSDMALSQKIPEAVFINMDRSTARHIVLSNTLHRKITAELIEDSPASTFNTVDKGVKLFITNFNNTTYINNNIEVVFKDLEATNGIIHVTDGLDLNNF